MQPIPQTDSQPRDTQRFRNRLKRRQAVQLRTPPLLAQVGGLLRARAGLWDALMTFTAILETIATNFAGGNAADKMGGIG
jgi:hypothetical protein